MSTETAPDSSERGERLSYFLDIGIAVLLGLAATATAWAAYQSSLFGGDEAEAFNTATIRTTEATLTTDEASQAWTEGNQVSAQDNELFFEYVKAAQEGNEDLALYLRESLMSADLIAAIEWWENEPDALTPFVEENPNWVNAAYDTAAALDEEAQVLLDEAAQANEDANKAGNTGDDYDFVTVVLASALFMLGIAGVFRHLPIKFGMSALGVALMLVGFIQLAGLDRA